MRLWKGSHVLALGCIPAHAALFSMYEHLKIRLELDNGQFNFVKWIGIGPFTTVMHDVFITPVDGKQKLSFFKLSNLDCVKWSNKDCNYVTI